MSIKGHINELSNKHRELDIEIQNAEKRPASDPIYLSELKRKKLRIKEQLENLAR